MARSIRIPLRTRSGSVQAYTLIDSRDADLAEHRWRLTTTGYAMRTVREAGKPRSVLLHRAVLGLSPGDGLEADHINRDRLDNRRANLRIVTHAQNHQNQGSLSGASSRYRGVTWNKQKKRWRARVVLDGRRHFLGWFIDEDEAGRVAAKWRSQHMTHSVEELLDVA